MERLAFYVDVDSGDRTNDRGYLQALREAFIAITNLQSWGYTGDEAFCRSEINTRVDGSNA